MTATVPGGRQAAASPVDRARGARRDALSTPSALRGLLVVLVLLSLAWGGFGGWVAAAHSSAANALVAVNEPLSLDARQMYQAIADADATITATYLASSQPGLTSLQRYSADLETAGADLSRLRSGDGSRAVSGALTALSGGLSAYAGYVGEAKAEFAADFPLTGGSFLQVASEEAHLVLLPAARTVFDHENAALNGASGDATGLPTAIAALVLAVITGYVLFRAQRWLARRTNRVLNPGLALASLLLIVAVAWLAVGFLGARPDLDRGIGQGSSPAQDLALASIGVQQIRGDAVLNVISRSGNASFEEDFKAMSKQVGPGAGTWLGEAAAAQGNRGTAATLVAQAEQEASAWYTANEEVYRLGSAADYAAERSSVIGTGAGSSAAGYNALETSITGAIHADQKVFGSAAGAGAHALDPFAGVVIATAAAMALCCYLGLRRRLAEYR